MTPAERLAWLSAKQTCVGASDAANLVGLGYGDALRVFRAKTEPVSADIPPDGPLARGIALEPLVAERYAEAMNIELLPPALHMIRHPTRPWQGASPDRIRTDGKPVQLKTVAGFGDEWGDSGTDEVPDGYRLQVQQEMGCLEADACDLAALDVIGWELRVYRFQFDAALFDWLTEVEKRFWFSHVVPRVAPAGEWEDQFRAEALARVVKPGTRVDLGEAGIPVLEQLHALAQIKAEAEAAYESARKDVLAAMGDAERADAGPWTVKTITVKPQSVPAKPAYEKPGYSYLGKPTHRKGAK